MIPIPLQGLLPNNFKTMMGFSLGLALSDEGSTRPMS